MIDPRRTLLFLIRDDEILLAMKKRGFGAGKWNGVGGKLEPEETLEQAAVRECQEEIGVTPQHFWKVSEFDFTGGSDKDQWNNLVSVYLCDEWGGEPTESEEMRPQWYKISDIPYGDMWDDDELWLAQILGGKSLKGTFTFDADDKMISHRVTETSLYEA